MFNAGPKCNRCGKARGHHLKGTLNCPAGMKFRGVYSAFLKDTFQWKPAKPRKRLPARGKKMTEWDRIRIEELKPAFEAAGITTCELCYPGCFRDNHLGFAHSLKRRNIQTPAQMKEVILACNPCHDVIEGMGEEEMNKVVLKVISNRKTPVLC